MATIQPPSPTFLHSPALFPSKTYSFSVRFGPFGSSSSRKYGSLAIKCSNNGGNATAKRNSINNLRNGLLDSLRKAAQKVVRPEAEAETKEMKQVISQLKTKDAERVVQHETEIKKMREELNNYKTRAEEKLVQRETEIKEMKEELSLHLTKAAEIEECQKRLSEALTLVAKAQLSLQEILLYFRIEYDMESSGSDDE